MGLRWILAVHSLLVVTACMGGGRSQVGANDSGSDTGGAGNGGEPADPCAGTDIPTRCTDDTGTPSGGGGGRVVAGSGASGASSSGDPATVCQQFVAHLRECGLVTDGALRCWEPESASEACEADCLINADCAGLAGLLCGGTGAALESCLMGCPPPGEFSCANGQQIPDAWVCDGDNDCGDLSDEQSCPAQSTFTCDNGAEIPARYQCDNDNDCGDGSDERGCAELCP